MKNGPKVIGTLTIDYSGGKKQFTNRSGVFREN
jgi:hypothetical protein